jgi:hypothetical protein
MKIKFIKKNDNGKIYSIVLKNIKIDINPESDILIGYTDNILNPPLRKIFYKDINIINKKEDEFIKTYFNKLVDEYNDFVKRINSNNFRQKYFIEGVCEDYDAITPDYYEQMELDCGENELNQLSYFEKDLNDCINLLNIKSPTVINMPPKENNFNFNLN